MSCICWRTADNDALFDGLALIDNRERIGAIGAGAPLMAGAVRGRRR